MYEVTWKRVTGKWPDISDARNEWSKTKSKGTVYNHSTLADKVARWGMG